MAEEALTKAERRILGLLRRGEAALEPAAVKGTMLLDAGANGVAAASPDLIETLVGGGLIEIRGASVRLTDKGRDASARLARDPVPARELALARIEPDEEGVAVALVNLDESPLARLARRRGRDGAPFLAEAEWQAGERFRADYTRGRIMPGLSGGWSMIAQGGRCGGARGGVSELTEAALAARMRVERALEAVGPELSGVLVDVCCFLKGLERVEMERGWPVRSAKILLKAALASLARHYDRGRSQRKAKIVHWGDEGYRPSAMAPGPTGST